jgi:hypothetical protein
LVSIADRVERIPEMLLQIEWMRRDIQVALVLLRKMTATTEQTDDTDLDRTLPQVEPLPLD